MPAAASPWALPPIAWAKVQPRRVALPALTGSPHPAKRRSAVIWPMLWFSRDDREQRPDNKSTRRNDLRRLRQGLLAVGREYMLRPEHNLQERPPTPSDGETAPLGQTPLWGPRHVTRNLALMPPPVLGSYPSAKWLRSSPDSNRATISGRVRWGRARFFCQVRSLPEMVQTRWTPGNKREQEHGRVRASISESHGPGV